MFSDSFENELAREIYMRNGSVSLNKPLALAKAEVALRGNDDLDELDNIHVKILACICEKANVKEEVIVVALEIKEEELRECLHTLHLCEYLDGDYKPTVLGKKVLFEIGIEVLMLDKYFMEGALKKTKWLLKYYQDNYQK